MTDPFAEYLQNPDRRQLSRFIVAYTEPVTRLVRRIVGCPDASRDVVQDVFLRLAEAELSPESVRYPRAYVLRAALNIAREYLRDEKTRRRHESEAARLKTTTSHSADEDLIAREAVERLYRNIDSLPEPLRVAIHLRAVDGLSYREIALVTGVSVGVVGSRIQKARQKLSELSGGRDLAMAWANLELARKQGWFPLGTDGLSSAALKRLNEVAKPARTMIAPAVFVALVALAALGVSVPWMSEGPPEVSTRSDVATSTGERRGGQIRAGPSVATSERPEKPMAPVVAGAETQTSTRGVEPEFERPGEALARESDGGETMKGKTLLASAVVAVGMAGAVGGAETGDFDGDGRLSIADVVLLKELARTNDPAAPGSLDALLEHPCIRSLRQDGSMIRGITYVESLRRNIPGCLAHWDPVWAESPRQDPLLPDDRVRIQVENLSVPGGEEDRIELTLLVQSDAPIRALSLAFETDGDILRPKPVPGWQWRSAKLWRDLLGISGDLWEPEGKVIHASPVTYLITQGRLVITYGVGDVARPVLTPGTHRFTINVRLPKGLDAGSYPVRLLAGSEVLFDDGLLIAPDRMEPVELDVQSEVTAGWDEGVPPFRFDPDTRRVVGRIEFRVVNGAGEAPADGEPVVTVIPGETFTLGLQMRTEVPLNQLYYNLTWPSNSFCGIAHGRPFEIPGEGESYTTAWTNGLGISEAAFGGLDNAWTLLGSGFPSSTFPDRLLEYYKPLGEWIDLERFDLKVNVSGATEIPLQFLPYSRDMLGWEDYYVPFPYSGFAPYGPDWPCLSDQENWPPERPWEYDVQYHDTFVRIVEGPAPVEPPEPILFFRVGNVIASPGELVRVPVFAAESAELLRARLVLDVDPEVVEVEGVDVPFRHPQTGEIESRIVRPDNPLYATAVRQCFDVDEDGRDDRCVSFSPSFVQLLDVGLPGHVFIRIMAASEQDPWPGRELREVFALLLRIREGVTIPETILRPGRFTYTEGLHVITVESGARRRERSEGCRLWESAEVETGRIVIASSFIRGDANADGQVNITDAVSTLGFLFNSTGEPACRKAADANDSGELNIADPIFALTVLFAGHGEFPPPFPGCGVDESLDDLTCSNPCS